MQAIAPFTSSAVISRVHSNCRGVFLWRRHHRKVEYIAGVEPAGICLRMTTSTGEIITVFPSQGMMEGICKRLWINCLEVQRRRSMARSAPDLQNSQ
jgi:hypothetical protein